MAVKEFFEEYPDDDGERTKVWIIGKNREMVGVNCVKGIFSRRPWVSGEVVETLANSADDERGVDLYVPIREELLAILGIRRTEWGIPIQIKSSLKDVKEFLKHKKMIHEGGFIFRNGNYFITLNGTDAELLVLADLVGQMLVLTLKEGVFQNEDDFLMYLGDQLGDVEAVMVWLEQREVILDYAWYRGLN